MSSIKPPHTLLTCSYSSILRGGKHVPLRDYNGCDAQHTDDNQVDEARLWITVERIIKPRNETSHNQKSNTRVIQSRIGRKKNPFNNKYYCSLHVPINSSWYELATIAKRRIGVLAFICFLKNSHQVVEDFANSAGRFSLTCWLNHWSIYGLYRYLLREESGDPFWVAVDCVEEPWKRKAENGPQEE